MESTTIGNGLDGSVVRNVVNNSDGNESTALSANQSSDYCFVCKTFFDRNLKKSRRRILRDRDDLVSPLLWLLWTAQRTGVWFSRHDLHLPAGPLPQQVHQHLQQLFACRKCFERVIKLERDVHNFELEMSQVLDQSYDTLLELDIIKGDENQIKQMKSEIQIKSDDNLKAKKVKPRKKATVVAKKKKKKKTAKPSVQPPQQTIQKTKQILVLAKGQEGEGQQLLVLQVPANDNDGDDSESGNQLIEYNPNIDHHYHNDENGAVFLSSNAIPVTTCVTVTSDDHQLVELQLEQSNEDEMEEECSEDKMEELEDVRADDDEEMREEEETNEAVNTIPAEEKDWDVYNNDGVIVVNHKRKVAEEGEVITSILSDDDIEMEKKSKKTKESYSKRSYTPRCSSPLPPAGESKVVVQLLYGSKQWKRTMDGEVKSIIRDMALRRPDPAGRKIAASDKLCSAVMKNHSKRLVSECKDAAKTIRVADHQDVTQLDMKAFTSEVFQKCPKTANLIKSLIPIEPRDTLDEHSATALIMGVILYMHSMQSNTLQHILSYVLRRAGCNREGFKFLHSLGLTLSYTSILKIMNDIDAKPDVEKSSLDTIEKSIDSVVIRTKIEAKNDSKKKSAQALKEEAATVGDPVLVQFSLPYFQTTTFTANRNSSVTYTTNQLANANQTTYTAVPFDTTDSSNVYTSQ